MYSQGRRRQRPVPSDERLALLIGVPAIAIVGGLLLFTIIRDHRALTSGQEVQTSGLFARPSQKVGAQPLLED